MSETLEVSLQWARAALIARQEALKQLSTDARASLQPVELDQSRVGRLSRMDALQMQAMAREEQRRRDISSLQVRAALDRIDQEDYGYCIVCDEPIARKRLEVDPAVPTCIRCARSAEGSV